MSWKENEEAKNHTAEISKGRITHKDENSLGRKMGAGGRLLAPCQLRVTSFLIKFSDYESYRPFEHEK